MNIEVRKYIWEATWYNLKVGYSYLLAKFKVRSSQPRFKGGGVVLDIKDKYCQPLQLIDIIWGLAQTDHYIYIYIYIWGEVKAF